MADADDNGKDKSREAVHFLSLGTGSRNQLQPHQVLLFHLRLTGWSLLAWRSIKTKRLATWADLGKLSQEAQHSCNYPSGFVKSNQNSPPIKLWR